MDIMFKIRSVFAGVADSVEVYVDGQKAGLLHVPAAGWNRIGNVPHTEWRWSLILVDGGGTHGPKWTGLAEAMQGTVEHITAKRSGKGR